MNQEIAFSIFIPSWNNLGYLKICINSIRKNSVFPHQIIVHINEGTDGTLEWVKEQNIDYTYSSKNIGSNFLSSYTKGLNPCPIKGQSSILCSRINAEGRGEIWRVNYQTGIEECIVSDPQRSFTTPGISPDGRWILFVGSNCLMNGNQQYFNTDIFACHVDGTQLVQLTYHAADDISPVWSRDGKHIFFVSQRGSSTGTANVWRMDFAY